MRNMTLHMLRTAWPLFLLFLIHDYFRTGAGDGSIANDERSISNSPEESALNSVEAGTHLRLSELFKQSDNYKCIVEQGRKSCIERQPAEGSSKAEFGPRFQKVHLALPRRDPREVGYTEEVAIAGRTLQVKTLSITPPIFEIPGFLTADEADLIIEMALAKGMKEMPPTVPDVLLPDTLKPSTFDQWDDDLNGFITIDELYSIMEFNPLLISKEELKKMLDEHRIDSDSNGLLSYGELSNDGLRLLKEALNRRMAYGADTKVQNVSQTWLWHDEDELLMYEGLLEDFHDRLSKISLLPTDLLTQSEPMQVTENPVNSSYPCQHDSEVTDPNKPCCANGEENCRMCRYGTMFFFLNDVEAGGELLFPMADNSSFSWENMREETIQKCEITPRTDVSNLIVKPERGKAVFWYNHAITPTTGWMSQLEPLSLSAGGKVLTGTRWTAKLWFDIIGDGVNELRPWKMGSNWLSENNKKASIIEEMRNDYFVEGTTYVHFNRPRYSKHPLVEVPIPPHKIESSLKQESRITTAEEDVPQEQQSSKVIEQEGSHSAASSDSEASQDIAVSIQILASNPDFGISLNEQTVAEKMDMQTEVDDPSPDPPEVNSKARLVDHTVPPRSTGRATPSDALPIGPPKGALKGYDPVLGYQQVENRLLKAALLLVEELERDELEVVARSLHDKLHLACIPLIVNPINVP